MVKLESTGESILMDVTDITIIRELKDGCISLKNSAEPLGLAEEMGHRSDQHDSLRLVIC